MTRCNKCYGPNVQTYDRSWVPELLTRMHNGTFNDPVYQKKEYYRMRAEAAASMDYTMKGVYCTCRMSQNHWRTDAEKEAYSAKCWVEHKRKQALQHAEYDYYKVKYPTEQERQWFTLWEKIVIVTRYYWLKFI